MTETIVAPTDSQLGYIADLCAKAGHEPPQAIHSSREDYPELPELADLTARGARRGRGERSEHEGSFGVLGREPQAILTRQATLALCASLLSDALGAGALTLRIAEASDAD